MPTCYLCQLFEQKKYILWENELLFAAFDTCPVSPGHTLLSTKRHVADFSKLTDGEYKYIREAIKNVITNIASTDLKKVYKTILNDHESDQSAWFCKKALLHTRINTKPDGYNHGFNDGKAAGQTVKHFHWHIIPRFDGDIENSIGGVRFVIPTMGDYQKSRK